MRRSGEGVERILSRPVAGEVERSALSSSRLPEKLLVPPLLPSPEIRRLVQLAQLELDLAVAVDRRPLPQPLERLRLRADLDDRVAGDELLRLGERPSTIVGLPPRNFTRAPSRDGRSPSPASMTPARTISSLYAVIASISSGVGIMPASVCGSALRMTMNRIVELQKGVHEGDERSPSGSTLRARS
jgi:hypothetical protein